MNKSIVYGGAGILAAIIILVVFVIQKEIRVRRKQTNIKLPDISEVEKNSRMEAMRKNSEAYSFANATNITEKDLREAYKEEDINKYLTPSKETTSIYDDLTGLLDEAGGIHPSSTRIVSGEVTLPSLSHAESEKEN